MDAADCFSDRGGEERRSRAFGSCCDVNSPLQYGAHEPGHYILPSGIFNDWE